MALAVEKHWNPAAPLEGIAITRYGHGVPTKRIRVVEAGHPVPDEAGEAAALPDIDGLDLQLRAGIGARIKVSVVTPKGGRSIYKTVNSGGSCGSSPLQQQIGLGDATAITSVQIIWPGSGSSQTLTGFALDHTYRIREDNPQPIAWELKRIQFDLSAQHSMSSHGGPAPIRSASNPHN